MRTPRPIDRFNSSEITMIKEQLMSAKVSCRKNSQQTGLPLTTVQRYMRNRIQKYLPVRIVFDANTIGASVYVLKATCTPADLPCSFHKFAGIISTQVLYSHDSVTILARVVAKNHEQFLRLIASYAPWRFEVLGVEQGIPSDYPANLLEYLQQNHFHGGKKEDQSEDGEGQEEACSTLKKGEGI